MCTPWAHDQHMIVSCVTGPLVSRIQSYQWHTVKYPCNDRTQGYCLGKVTVVWDAHVLGLVFLVPKTEGKALGIQRRFKFLRQGFIYNRYWTALARALYTALLKRWWDIGRRRCQRQMFLPLSRMTESFDVETDVSATPHQYTRAPNQSWSKCRKSRPVNNVMDWYNWQAKPYYSAIEPTSRSLQAP